MGGGAYMYILFDILIWTLLVYKLIIAYANVLKGC